MAILYVDGDNGSDSNDGSSEALAKKTIQAAVNAAANGDTIYIQNNGSTVYTEAVEWETPDKGLALIGYGTTPGDGVRFELDGTGVPGAEGFFIEKGYSGTSTSLIQNAFIHDYFYAGIRYDQDDGSYTDFILVDNVKVLDCGAFGIDVSSGRCSARISRCDIQGCGSVGITINHGCVLLSRCINNGGVGIQAYLYGEVLVAFCQIAGNSTNCSGGMYLVCCTLDAPDTGTSDWVNGSATNKKNMFGPPTAIGCAFTSAPSYGIASETPAELGIFGCGFYDNTAGDIDGTPGINVGSITGEDPRYRNPAGFDFRLDATSPWRMLGLKVGLPDDPDEQLSYPDIGAMQVPSASAVLAAQGTGS